MSRRAAPRRRPRRAHVARGAQVFREEDKESGVCAVRPGFKVVVSTNLPADEVHAKLKDVLPLGRCQVIKVKSS